jgi:hypothetical protein
VLTPILAYDERQAQQDLARYAVLAAQNRGFRAEVQAAERRLAVIGEMRALYNDLRADQQRVAASLGGLLAI